MNYWSAFLRGINYWPASKAMYWWKDFDLKEVEEDFDQLNRFNFKIIRFFLTWEDFQPQPDKISYQLIDCLKRLADLAYDMGLYLMPTFFCGHMSGVNWIPEWMLETKQTKQRFPVYSNGKLSYLTIRNFYMEEDLIAAQLLQIRTVCGALAEHPAVLAYDLGNESSNCVIPPNRKSANRWLKEMSTEIKLASASNLITLGMHAEDLEENRHLWPQDAAQFCDFLCMHGYPFYLAWVDNPLDFWVLPFLGIITQWLGKKAVLFQEFGIPTYQDKHNDHIKYTCPIWSETDAASYYQYALLQLEEAGMLGAMAWCFADYHPALWDQVPLRDNPHERHFGMFRQDSSAKLNAKLWRDHFAAKMIPINEVPVNNAMNTWLNGFNPDHFFDYPKQNLAKLFKRYKEYLVKGSAFI